MKQLLEVVLKDDGSLDIICHDEKFIDRNVNMDNLPKSDAFFKKLTALFVKKLFKEKDAGVSKYIKVLSMAELCASIEPYAQTEEFWSMMMFSFIPRMEKYTDNLKKKYGYHACKQRPVTFGDTSMFQLLSSLKN